MRFLHELRLSGWLVVVACVALPLLYVAGCGGGDGDQEATVRVALTDAASAYESVVVAVSEVRLVPAGSEGLPTGGDLPLVVSYDTPVQYDVMDLAFVQEVLGEARVPTGSYSQVRLVLAPNPATGDPLNHVTLDSAPLEKLPLDTPSGQQSGLKVIGDYDIEPGVVNAIALDLDPSRAVVEAGSSGKYILKPTGIRIVQLSSILETYGSLSGHVLPDTAWPSAVVSVIPEGGNAPVASGSVNPDDGSFRAFVPAGSYAVRITADGFATYDSRALPTPAFYTVTLGAETVLQDVTLVP